jgi:hypothetical protein
MKTRKVIKWFIEREGGNKNMTANTTEIMLGQLNSGELQRLSAELLPRLYKDWGPVSQSGTVEGTNKTRKGTPDAWCERDDGSYVYIQATGDKQKGKFLEDLQKSVKKLVTIEANEGALCIAFLSHDPQTEEIEECKKLAKKHKITFQYYSNSAISKLLDKDHNDLRYKYLKIPSPVKEKAKAEHLFALAQGQGSEATTAANMNKVLDWNVPDEDLKGTLEDILQFYGVLKKLNLASRRFFTSLVELAEPLNGFSDHKMTVPYQEVANALGLENREINAQMNILEKYKLGYIEDGEWPVEIIVQASGWAMLPSIKEYAEKEGLDLKEILVNLQFSLLD